MALTVEQAVKGLVIENLVFYDAPVSEMKVRMFAKELMDLDPDSIAKAFSEFRKEKGRRQMPMPSDVRNKIAPEDCSDRALATEASARILTAVSRFGHNNLELAREFIGQLGWSVVKMQGGWNEICRCLGEEVPASVAQAQWIKLAESLMEMKRANRFPEDRTEKTKISGPSGKELMAMEEMLKNIMPANPPEGVKDESKPNA